ncbi:TetR/AcrR family transcriptional regulator [Rhizobium sp. 16-449-1b]|uniref:TetR/AcrR family transcriptional regulator n=1 Tax=Rhizobium sp. 16-449-1b TaxID=2819989 RepID=UPI001ADD4C00|nr:TetR/AcrR family transcriptional regulator [Rhizobium sp. 16-449-1b]MBO9198177.1 TetR/AcrR family transcriptional regulator [Rhizobium sp. 16-449-1b]
MDDDQHAILVETRLVPQQRRSREARARIMSAAEELLRNDGVEAFSMMGVAQRAQMPVGNIYRRFEGKEDLLLALKELVCARIRNGIAQSVLAHGPDSMETFVRCFADAVGKAFAHDERLNRSLYDQRLVSPKMIESGQAARGSIFGLFADGLGPYLSHHPSVRADAIAKVAFSIIMNAAALKVRDNDAILATSSWDEIASEFGAAAVLYIQSKF